MSTCHHRVIFQFAVSDGYAALYLLCDMALVMGGKEGWQGDTVWANMMVYLIELDLRKHTFYNRRTMMMVGSKTSPLNKERTLIRTNL